ncbi:MAG: single-stranded DNA-binding protein [Bacteroidales bacterium]|nr:single-stranded DNA-binding protein [Bacteroidales bacterium]
MNTLRNSVKLIGRLGHDPEVKTLDKGSKLAKFSLATSDNFTAKDGSKQEQTQWHNIVVFGNLAGICEKYLKKGREIAIDGRLTYRSWEDKNGTKHISSEIIANDFLFVGSNNEGKK